MVARPEGSASGRVRSAVPAEPDRAAVLGLQPGLCPGPERACLPQWLDRHNEGRDDAAGRRREGIQARRGDVREIPDRVGRIRRRAMTTLSRRSVLRSSLAAAAAGTLARPHIANAAATTATAWWVQGSAEEEDISFKKIVADYQKASGNTIDYTITPYAPLRQKIVSAVTSGVVPDLFQNNPYEILALYAWNDQLADVSDIVETQKSQYNETALLTAYCYNSAEKRRSFYGVPYTSAVRPNHIWRPLVEKAGYTMEDLPRTWDAFYDFFKEVQKKLRAQG